MDAQFTKERIGKLNFIEIKSSCSVQDTVKRMKGQATQWVKIFAKDVPDKGLLSKIKKKTLKT